MRSPPRRARRRSSCPADRERPRAGRRRTRARARARTGREPRVGAPQPKGGPRARVRLRSVKPRNATSAGSDQRAAYVVRSSAVTSPPRSSISSSSARPIVPSYTPRGPSSASDSSAGTRPGCLSRSPSSRTRAAGRVDLRALVHRHHRLQHPQTGRVRRRHRDGRPREPQSRLDETRPGQAPVLVPERVEPRRDARDPARADADGVVDELRPERHLELDERDLAALASQPGNRDEAVEVARRPRGGVEVDPVPAAEQAGHHGLGHTGRKSRGHRGVGRVPALGEDLRARLRGGRMAGGDAASHARSLNPSLS